MSSEGSDNTVQLRKIAAAHFGRKWPSTDMPIASVIGGLCVVGRLYPQRSASCGLYLLPIARIGGPPIAQTILAIAFLIFVTLLSFLAVAFIGRLLGNNEATHWLIELIFAILCAGACWRSADVGSTLNIPGSPVEGKISVAPLRW